MITNGPSLSCSEQHTLKLCRSNPNQDAWDSSTIISRHSKAIMRHHVSGDTVDAESVDLAALSAIVLTDLSGVGLANLICYP